MMLEKLIDLDRVQLIEENTPQDNFLAIPD